MERLEAQILAKAGGINESINKSNGMGKKEVLTPSPLIYHNSCDLYVGGLFP
jgi:hypothetical protein